MKFQEGDYVLVNGEMHRIETLVGKACLALPIVWRNGSTTWYGWIDQLAKMQTGYWRQVENLCRVPGPVKYDSPGKWANFPEGVPVVPLKMTPVWEHVT